MSKTANNSRPLLPNHNEKVARITERLINRGRCGYDANVLHVADEFGMKYPVVTCKQRDNRYTKPNIYGFELEFSCDVSSDEIYKKIKYPFGIIKSDSSVATCRQYAYEFTSLPGSLKALSVLGSDLCSVIYDVSENDLNEIGGENRNEYGERTGCNGIHVHVCKDNFIDTRHKRNFFLFYNDLQNMMFMYQMSDRTNVESFLRWASPVFQSKSESRFSFIKQVTSRARGQQKYTIVNATHSKTYEVRMFQADASAATLVKNLQFVDSTVEFTKERSAATTTLKHYLAWLDNTDNNRYTELKAYISEMDFDSISKWQNFIHDLVESNKKKSEKFKREYEFSSDFNDLFVRLASNSWQFLHTSGPNDTMKVVVESKGSRNTVTFKQHHHIVSKYARITRLTSEAA